MGAVNGAAQQNANSFAAIGHSRNGLPSRESGRVARAILPILAVQSFGAAAYAYFTDARQTLRALASGDAVVGIARYPLELGHIGTSDRRSVPVHRRGPY